MTIGDWALLVGGLIFLALSLWSAFLMGDEKDGITPMLIPMLVCACTSAVLLVGFGQVTHHDKERCSLGGKQHSSACWRAQ